MDVKKVNSTKQIIQQVMEKSNLSYKEALEFLLNYIKEKDVKQGTKKAVNVIVYRFFIRYYFSNASI